MLTLPKLFWVIYDIIIFLTLITGVINWIRRRYSALSAITIILSLLVPVVSFVYTVGRNEGMNELEFLIAQFKTRDPWSMYIIVGYFYLLVWWYFFISSFSYHKFNQTLQRIITLLKNRFNHILAKMDKEKNADGEREK